jgi:hypothetical protein
VLYDLLKSASPQEYNCIMRPLPDRPATQPAKPRRVRVIRVSVQPKTWFGKLVASIVAAALMLIALFFSIIVFAIIACIVVVMIIYSIWAAHRARRSPD